MTEKITISLPAYQWEAILRGLTSSGWDGMHAVLSHELSEVRAGVVAEEPEPSDQVKQLLRDMTDPDDCWFDHHGGCQAHGYLSLQAGEKCPHAEAKELLASWVPVKQEDQTTNHEIRRQS